MQQIANRFGVSKVTALEWARSGKIESDIEFQGFRGQYVVTEEAADRFAEKRDREQLEASLKQKKVFSPSSLHRVLDKFADEKNAREFCELHQATFGSVPRLWGRYKHGEVTYRELIDDTVARIEGFLKLISEPKS